MRFVMGMFLTCCFATLAIGCSGAVEEKQLPKVMPDQEAALKAEHAAQNPGAAAPAPGQK